MSLRPTFAPVAAFFPVVFAFLSLFLAACGGSEDRGPAPSRLSQLTRVEYPCKVWEAERVDSLTTNLPRGFLVDWNGEMLDHVHQALAGVPDSYMGWLYQVRRENGFYIAARDPGFNGGVTVLDSARPHYIHVYPSNRVVDLALQHEVGHALYPRVRASGGAAAFDRELAVLSSQEYDNPELNRYPASYPRDSLAYQLEFFAEAFNSYYCSEDTHAMVREQFPSTCQFLERHLAAPVWP